MSSAVTNPGCERTAGKITGVRDLVNRTLVKFGGFLFFADRPAARSSYSIEIGSTSTATSIPSGGRHRFGTAPTNV